ncbi:hypothetical protein EDE15_0810 [Edaphobacter aggregans]|uniref:Uncharacterized protein n=1 Tax=Edaphobacter aggregans TaxID=570835 RepID=A0A3R9NRN8_9BACT|nr:hypothetical protein [Edaphobacter aggregans]RSL15325.1 hypothetical protein EDE15_0810 [Edaphobacter aggregans]
MRHVPVLVVLRYELWFFVGGLAIIITYRLLNGVINTNYLLSTKGPDGSYSPARLQLFLSTLVIAIYYAYRCYQLKGFAPVPPELGAALGGSNVFYVVRKFLNESAGR